MSQQPRSPERLVWTKELVHQFWDGIAQTRLIERSFSRTGGHSMAVLLDSFLKETDHILDFGAGDGDLVRILCGRGFHVAAYEPSAERARHIGQQMAGMKGFLGAETMASGKSYDVIVAAEVLEHVLEEELDATLGKLHAFLKPGGTLIVTVPNNEDLDLNMVYCPVSNKLFHRWQHVRSFDPPRLEAFLGRYGFRKKAIHSVSFFDKLFVPYDRLWGEPAKKNAPPDYLKALRANEPTSIGDGYCLVYVGTKD